MAKLFSQFIQESLKTVNEALQSDILRKFVRTSRELNAKPENKKENLIKTASNFFWAFDSSSITDDDFVVIPMDKARTGKFYNNYVYFWFKDDQPIGITQKGDVLYNAKEWIRGYGRRGRGKYKYLANVKQIQDESTIVYGLSNERYEQAKEVRMGKRHIRNTAKEDATALMTPEQFKEIFNKKIETLRKQVKIRKDVQGTPVTKKLEDVMEKASKIYTAAYPKIGEEQKGRLQKTISSGQKDYYSLSLSKKLATLQGNIEEALDKYGYWIQYGRNYSYDSTLTEVEKFIKYADQNIQEIEKILTAA